jgi:phage FluMu gp28-like protein
LGDLLVWAWYLLAVRSIVFKNPEPWIAQPKCVQQEQDIIEFARRLGFEPDEKQCEILRSTAKRGILNCTRQWGKTQAIAAKVVHHLFTQPDRLVIVASTGKRASGTFIRRVKTMLRKLGVKAQGDGDNELSVLLPNNSLIVGLPHAPDNIRGFAGATMVVIEEAAYVSDEMYAAVAPMLATTNGPLWMLSTSGAKSGFFYETWQHGGPEWHRVRVLAADCPRISQEFLDKEIKALGMERFRREFLCEFTGTGANAFDRDVVERALDDSIEPIFMLEKPRLVETRPLWLTARADEWFFVGVDLGKQHDYSTIVIVEKRGDELLVRGAERIPLGTPYSRLVEILREVVRRPELAGRCSVVVDATGLGEPVMEMIRRADLGCDVTAAVISGGKRASRKKTGKYKTVPKYDLMTGLQVALEDEELKIARRMSEARSLVKELTDIRVNERGGMGAEGSGQHDDLVMAVALACWRAKRGQNDWGAGGAIS